MRISRERIVDVLLIAFFATTGDVLFLLPISSGDRYVWLLADIVMICAIAGRPRDFQAIAQQNLIMLSWPLLAMLSALWSLVPGLSLYYGLQLFATVLIAFTICAHADRERIIRATFWAFLVCQILSLAVNFGTSLGLGADGAWSGLFFHKNELGMMMTIQAMTCLCLLMMKWRPMIVTISLVLAVFLLFKSKSGASLIAFAVAGGLVPFAVAYRSGIRLFISLAALACIASAAVVLLIALIDSSVSELILSGLGKDSTLTGRTFLWEMAWQSIEQNPLLGLGYAAYWNSNESTVSYLRLVVEYLLHHFHNNFLEVTVGLGIVGLALFVAGIVAGYYRAAKSFLLTADVPSLWSLLLITSMVTSCVAEVWLFKSHALTQVLFVIAVAIPLMARRESGLQRHVKSMSGSGPILAASGATR